MGHRAYTVQLKTKMDLLNLLLLEESIDDLTPTSDCVSFVRSFRYRHKTKGTIWACINSDSGPWYNYLSFYGLDEPFRLEEWKTKQHKCGGVTIQGAFYHKTIDELWDDLPE